MNCQSVRKKYESTNSGDCLKEMRKIAPIVYDLYELTEDEIKVVEGEE